MLVVFLLVMLSTFRNASTQTDDGYEVDDMILSYEQVGWLQDGLLEGELDGVTAEDNLMDYGQANALIAPDKKWPNNRVYYSFAKLPKFKLSQIHQEKVRKVLKGLQEKLNSCITFEEKKTGSRIIVKSHRQKCESHVGYMRKPKGQMLNLGDLCFEEKDGRPQDGIIEHEFLHALGIYHTQSRSDRNDYIKINNDSIDNLPRNYKNFNSYDSNRVSHYGLPYDYDSVMHYGKSDFAKRDGLITIETLDSTKEDVIGQRDGVSIGDIELVKRAYECPSAAVNGGYTEWSRFDECSKTCGEGEGTQTWYRTCTNPEPRHNKDFKGLTCEEQNLGPAIEPRSCNLGPCAVNGGYTQWSKFGSCSNTCGDGTQSKYRTCTNPQPQYNGLTCEEQNLGPATETKACNLGQCEYPNDSSYQGSEDCYDDEDCSDEGSGSSPDLVSSRTIPIQSSPIFQQAPSTRSSSYSTASPPAQAPPPKPREHFPRRPALTSQFPNHNGKVDGRGGGSDNEGGFNIMEKPTGDHSDTEFINPTRSRHKE